MDDVVIITSKNQTIKTKEIKIIVSGVVVGVIKSFDISRSFVKVKF